MKKEGRMYKPILVMTNFLLLDIPKGETQRDAGRRRETQGDAVREERGDRLPG
jgi:hypothetical protein